MPHPMQDTAPSGWTYVDFEGGSLDGQYRLIRGEPEAGDTYETIGTREQWRFNGAVYVYAGRTLRTLPSCDDSPPSGASG